jgi:hypothetical protein
MPTRSPSGAWRWPAWRDVSVGRQDMALAWRRQARTGAELSLPGRPHSDSPTMAPLRLFR